MTLPPTNPTNPPLEGYIRHQYVFAIETAYWDKLTKDDQDKLLVDYFGLMGIICMEQVREDDKWIAWHYWLDLPEDYYNNET